jgi:hypothetical protein
MTIRQYKKRYAICKDDNGKVIYAGDTVELNIPWETSSTYQSKVYWSMLHGAFVDSHPAHISLQGRNNHRNLSDFLNQEPIKITYDTGEQKTKCGCCRKVKSFYKQ